MLVQRDRLGLTNARLEDETRHAERPCLGLESAKKRSADPATARLRADIHPLELSRLLVDASNRTAPDRLAGPRSNQERSPARGYLVRIDAKVRRALFGVATRQLGVERADERLRGGRHDVDALDEHELRGVT